MALETNTVDLDAARFEGGDEVCGSGGFGAGIVDVVIIVVELDVWVIKGGSLKGDGDVLGADGVVEDIRSVGTVVIEGFVHDVPGVTLALVVGDFALDMSLHSSNQSFVRPCTASNPVWQL